MVLKYSIEEFGVEIDGIYDILSFDIPMFIDLVEKTIQQVLILGIKANNLVGIFVFG